MSCVVIAHRGASGYLPEHTLPAKALAYAMGADFLEQDVVASRDDELVVLHDIHLDRVSNVAEAFPERARPDGRYYVRDFDLDELRSLRVWERMEADGTPAFSGRYPPRSGDFRMHALRDELELLRALNLSTGRNVGVYPEIKSPAWHRGEGVDITPVLLTELAAFGFDRRSDAAVVQCFDADELVRIRNSFASDLRLVQLVGENAWREAPCDYDAMRTPQGLAALAATVDGIGPWIEQLYHAGPEGPRSSGLVEAAHAAGLEVHPYTFRRDSLPKGFTSPEAVLDLLVKDLGVDGLFTDFPDTLRRYIDSSKT